MKHYAAVGVVQDFTHSIAVIHHGNMRVIQDTIVDMGIVGNEHDRLFKNVADLNSPAGIFKVSKDNISPSYDVFGRIAEGEHINAFISVDIRYSMLFGLVK